MWRTSEDSKRSKRWANKKVRKSDVPDGKQYRKVYDPWNIVDCKNLQVDDDGSVLSLTEVRIKIKNLSNRYRNGEHDLRTDIHYLIDAISK